MTLPILGAALTIDEAAVHHNWLRAKPRDIELQDFVRVDVLDGDWLPLVQQAAKVLDGHDGRLGIHGPFWGFTIDSADPDIRKLVTRRLLQGLQVVEALDGTHMVIHSPYTTWDYNNLDKDEGAREGKLERCHDTLEQVVRRAEDIGCRLVVENIEDIDPADRLALADSFQSEAVSVSIDTGHAYYAHRSTGAPPVDYFVISAGDRLGHIHLQDADGYADRHWSLGEGTIPWHAVFTALAKLNSNPRLIIEIKDKSKIPASAAYLESLGLAQ